MSPSQLADVWCGAHANGACLQADLDAGVIRVFRNTVYIGTLIGQSGTGAAFETDAAPLSPVVRHTPTLCVLCDGTAPMQRSPGASLTCAPLCIIPIARQVLVRGNDASAVIRVRTDIASLKGVTTRAQQQSKSASKLSAAIDALEWFNEIETANTTLSQWGGSGVPHSLLQSVVYPKLVEQYTVRL